MYASGFKANRINTPAKGLFLDLDRLQLWLVPQNSLDSASLVLKYETTVPN